MKLTNLLSKIILEGMGKFKPIANFVNDGYSITLNASFHQSIDRQGIKSLNDIVDTYEENFIKKPKFYERVGVPNSLIKNIFINDFNLINNRMSNLSLTNFNNSVVFIKEVGDRLDLPHYMNFAEFLLLTHDLKNYTIVTSVFSEDGSYLKTFGKTQNSPRFLL
jgi:hypothetical protein